MDVQRKERSAARREPGRAGGPMLVGVAAHFGVRGGVEKALDVAVEAASMIGDGMDPGEVVAIETGPAYWLLVAGRLPQALAAFDRIIERTGGDPQVGRDVVGFGPLIWAEGLGSYALAMIGRFDESWPRAARATRLAREHDARENLGWALGGYGLNSYIAGGLSGVPVAAGVEHRARRGFAPRLVIRVSPTPSPYPCRHPHTWRRSQVGRPVF